MEPVSDLKRTAGVRNSTAYAEVKKGQCYTDLVNNAAACRYILIIITQVLVSLNAPTRRVQNCSSVCIQNLI